MFDSIDVDFGFSLTGSAAAALPTAAPVVAGQAANAGAGSSGSSGSTGSSGSAGPLAIVDATAETKLWLKVAEAVRVGPSVIFKAKQAVRRLGKSTVAKASGAVLEKFIAEADACWARLQDMSLEHIGAEQCAQFDVTSAQADLRDLHNALQELHKGSQSAVSLRDKEKDKQ